VRRSRVDACGQAGDPVSSGAFSIDIDLIATAIWSSLSIRSIFDLKRGLPREKRQKIMQVHRLEDLAA
jgi:hypothetical protein